ncbi:MAG TPA: DUF6602 domain-containing protein [Stenomitos sp.]
MTEDPAITNHSQRATARWFSSIAAEIESEYARLHEEAQRDPQYAGHETEQAWKRILEAWLPPGYGVGTRKYILPDINTASNDALDIFETDIVVFNPAYPMQLRQRAEVLSGGIVGAFSVKLTANPDGIRDASKRAATLKRGSTVKQGTPRLYLQGPFVTGLLAHSHVWKAAGSTPIENVEKHLVARSEDYATEPKEVIDLVCVADLATWSKTQQIHPDGSFLPIGGGFPRVPQEVLANSEVWIGIGAVSAGVGEVAIARFILQFFYKLSYIDPLFRHWTLGLLAALPVASTVPNWRRWKLRDVFPARTISDLSYRGFDNIGGGQNDWQSIFA